MAEKDMEILAAAEGKEISVAGTTVRVKPYNWVNTFKLAKPLKVILGKYTSFFAAFTAKNDDNDFQMLFAILDNLQDPDELIEAILTVIEGATDKDKAWLETLMLDDLFTLGKAVYEVNSDFFGKRIAPMLPKIQKNEESKKPAK